MRLVFYYPFTARIGHHLREFIRFKSHGAYRKYHYFIPYFFNHKSREVAIFIDSEKKFPLYVFLKCIFWMLINGIRFTKILYKPSQLDPTQDVVLAFPGLSFHETGFQKTSLFHQFPGLKVFHLSHYFGDTTRIGQLIRELKNVTVIAETNLEKNPLYKKYIGNAPCHIIPFALRSRYKSTTDFKLRKAKCLACGTKSKVDINLYREFYETFKVNYLHKLRGELYEKRKEVSPWIESLIFDYQELDDTIPKTKLDRLARWIRKRIGNDRKQFFSFDIVQKYNEYQMFVSPEEESGAPPISFIEGMACGCCYLGRPEYYTHLGMVPGVHFVSYDGTLSDLISKVSYYQANPELAAQIAENGKKFVETHFKEGDVAHLFWKFFEIKKDSLCASA